MNLLGNQVEGPSNMSMHPTVSRVTPPAKSGNRRAARPAGDGPRYADNRAMLTESELSSGKGRASRPCREGAGGVLEASALQVNAVAASAVCAGLYWRPSGLALGFNGVLKCFNI